MTKSRFMRVAVWVVFPLSILAFYLFRTYVRGQQIDLLIPGAMTFISIGFMILLEQLFRYEHRQSQRRVLWRDVSSTLMHIFVTGNVLRMVFVPAVLFLPEFLFGRSLFFASTADLGPFWLQFILVVLMQSFMRYSIHRLQHTVPVLWKLHTYHHTVSDIRASNLLVSHPLDYGLRNVLPPVILAVVGFDPSAILFGAGLVGVFSTFSHCGAGLHAGWLNKIFVTPEVHRWHHSIEIPEGHKYGVNYGVGFALWDRLLGTYYLPHKDGIPVQPKTLGVEGIEDESNYLKMFFLTRYLPKLRRAPAQEA